MTDHPIPDRLRDLLARLHENLDDTLTTRLRAYYTSAETRAEAADRIEALCAERDTLAEMVRLFDPWVTLRVAGHGPYLAHRRPAPGEHITLTPEQAERFRAVLDRITKEASDE